MPTDREDDPRAGSRAPEGRRFLVTGALGAIGVWTIRSLLDRGHAVVALDVGGDGHRLPIALAPDEVDALPLVRADITDLAALELVLDEHAITDVIHLAALQVPFVRADPALGARVNVAGTVNVLEAVRRRGDRMGPVVYASSIAAFGPRGTLDGDDPPGTLYGVFKRTNETTALRYFEDFGVSSVGLRPHTVYGPARDQGVTSSPTVAMVAAAAGVPFHIPFGGSVQLQYAPDVGEAFARTAELAPAGAAVHNLDGPVVPIAELAAMIGAAAPAGGAITADDTPLPFPSSVDGASFVTFLGGSVMRPAAEGVADALERFARLLAEGVVAAPEPTPAR
jgi:UDP-glucuronate 4-epimerase